MTTARAQGETENRIVLLDALAKFVHRAEIVLGVGYPVLGSEAIPFQRFGIVLRHALATGVHPAKIVLC